MFDRPKVPAVLAEHYAAKLFKIDHPRTVWALPRPHAKQQELRDYYRQHARVMINNMVDDPEFANFYHSANRPLAVYDWAYNDPISGRQLYARTPEQAEKLKIAGVILTPVYTIESVSKG